MRIIQVVHQFLPQHLAGTEVYTYNLSQELSQRHQVWIYTREDSPIPDPEEPHETDEVYDGLPVRRVYFNPPNLQGNLLGLFLNRTQNKTIEAFFARFLEENGLPSTCPERAVKLLTWARAIQEWLSGRGYNVRSFGHESTHKTGENGSENTG